MQDSDKTVEKMIEEKIDEHIRLRNEEVDLETLLRFKKALTEVSATSRREERKRTLEKVFSKLSHYTVKCKENRRLADFTTEQFRSLFEEELQKES